jgi:LacI family transcriptional regulator
MASDNPVTPLRRRATIRDVARLANASTAAVSRVLRDADGVSENMTVRVKTAMAELGYRPHAAARGMRGKTYTVGVVHPDLRNTFFPDIIAAMADLILPTGRQIFFATTEWTSAEEVLAAMHDRQIEGLIVIAPTIIEAKLIDAAQQMPMILTHRHRYSDWYDTVVSDDDEGAALVVRHLAELGHQRIAHVGPAKGKQATQLMHVTARRARGYKNAMEELGLGAFTQIVDCPHYSVEDGYRVGSQALEMPDRPTAIFAGTDDVAFGVMQAAFEKGVRIPDDLSLVGYDNTRTAALAPMSLTSVDQDPAAIGARAASLLLSRIEGRREAERSLFAPTLVVRKTTAPPRG